MSFPTTTMKQAIKSTLHQMGWHVGRRNPYTAPFLDGEINSLFDYQLFRAFEGKLEGLRFIQIGANDGVQLDPLRHFIVKYHWKGVMLEPVKQSFDALEKLYADNENITVLRAAIDETPETRPMYRVSDPDEKLPEFTRAISSFSREHLLKFSSLVPDIEKYIVEEPVPCLTLNDIIENHTTGTFDLLQIDTEGHDEVVLRQLDLTKHQPKLIQFEHVYLEAETLTHRLLDLHKHQYAFSMEGRDVCAIREKAPTKSDSSDNV